VVISLKSLEDGLFGGPCCYGGKSVDCSGVEELAGNPEAREAHGERHASARSTFTAVKTKADSAATGLKRWSLVLERFCA
jgi:hypothetical protein